MRARSFVRLLLAALFLFAGIVHLLTPSLFLPVMPPWIPYHLACIEISGVAEILGGIGLLIPHLAPISLTAWGLVALLIAVFPANIYMAVAQIKVHGIPAQPWIAWARLALQPVLILAVLWSTKPWFARQRS